jgi:hypothetical protein
LWSYSHQEAYSLVEKIRDLSQVLVAHACNPVTQEAQIRRIEILTWPNKYFARTYLKKKKAHHKKKVLVESLKV